MPVYKATMFFEGEFIPPSGFSESWEFSRSTDEDAGSVALAMVGERRKALSNNWAIRSVRIARLMPTVSGPTCRLRHVAVTVPGCIADSQGLLGATDTPWTAIYVEIPTKQSTPSVSLPPRPRRYQMRGIPDTWWDGATQQNPPVPGAHWASHHTTRWLCTDQVREEDHQCSTQEHRHRCTDHFLLLLECHQATTSD